VIIDTSAVLAILFQEADAPQYAQVIAIPETVHDQHPLLELEATPSSRLNAGSPGGECQPWVTVS
jgi:uncharacterized protein with PIN domain